MCKGYGCRADIRAAQSDAKTLFELIAAEKGLRPALVEKDYWIMHCLWGLQRAGLQFEMDGGTSLSKGWGVVNRFSEVIDIRFDSPSPINLKGDKPAHIKARFAFYDDLARRGVKRSPITERRLRRIARLANHGLQFVAFRQLRSKPSYRRFSTCLVGRMFSADGPCLLT